MNNNNKESTIYFIGLTISHRKDTAQSVNNVLTEYGDSIISRSGCYYQKNNSWIISLAVDADNDTMNKFLSALNHVQGIHIQNTFNCQPAYTSK